MLLQPSNGKKVHWQEFWRHEMEPLLQQRPVVIVPVGSVEQHGPHCPLDVDISIPFHLAVRVAETVDDVPVLVAPPVTYGFTHYNMGEIGTISLKLETFIDVLCDVCRSIWANGFHRIIMVNGHGGNDAPVRCASVKLAEEDVWALGFSHWNMATAEMLAWSDADNGSVGHGGEWETSLQMYLRPHLISEPHMVKDEWRLKFSDEIGKFAKFPERRREMANGVMGDPFVASAEKGEKLFNLYVERLSQLVREYSAAEPPAYFEFGSHCPYELVEEKAAV
ncbi:MAG TPA: creatininase family protein [Thermomicrobiales bacterium]|nr:creatininase family protein [Thermomicrobiales bacterium]